MFQADCFAVEVAACQWTLRPKLAIDNAKEQMTLSGAINWLWIQANCPGQITDNPLSLSSASVTVLAVPPNV